MIRYLLVTTAANFIWEVAQLPLYTLWQTGTWSELAYAAIHCTVGDALILTTALLLALLAMGKATWPRQGYVRVALTATFLGVSYAVFSEWLNVDVSHNWAYAPAMPLLPPLGTGLTPFLQWLIIPPATAALVRPVQTTDMGKRAMAKAAKSTKQEETEDYRLPEINP